MSTEVGQESAATGRPGLTSRLTKLVTGNPIYHAFSSLLLSQLLAMAVGYLFWLWAARELVPVQIGASIALVNSMTLIAAVTSLGAPVVAASELPSASAADRVRILRALYLLVGTVSVVVGAAFPFVARLVSDTYQLAFSDWVSIVAFPIGVCLTAWGNVADQASIAVRRNAYPVLRNIVASVLRFPVAVALVLWTGLDRSHDALFAAWVLALVVGLAIVARRLLLGLTWQGAWQASRETLRRQRHLVTNSFTLSLSLIATGYVVPVVGAIGVAPDEYAQLGVTWLFASIVFVPPFILAESMLAGSGHMSKDAFLRTIRRTIPGATFLSIVLALGTALLGRHVLTLYGATYGHEAYRLLVLVLPAGPGLVLIDHYFAVARVRRRFRLAAGVAAVALTAQIIGAAVGVALGAATWLCVGWVCAVYVCAIPMLVALGRWLRANTSVGELRTT